MDLKLSSSAQSDSYAISIHKITPDEITLAPGQKQSLKALVFARNTGFHFLEALKIHTYEKSAWMNVIDKPMF